jgi:hypothetical protein
MRTGWVLSILGDTKGYDSNFLHVYRSVVLTVKVYAILWCIAFLSQYIHLQVSINYSDAVGHGLPEILLSPH